MRLLDSTPKKYSFAHDHLHLGANLRFRRPGTHGVLNVAHFWVIPQNPPARMACRAVDPTATVRSPALRRWILGHLNSDNS